jgi:hypothetical protein
LTAGHRGWGVSAARWRSLRPHINHLAGRDGDHAVGGFLGVVVELLVVVDRCDEVLDRCRVVDGSLA